MTSRIKPIEADNASKEQNEVLNLINQKFGRIPNIFALMANSPQSIKGYLAFNEALSNGVLSPQIRERIAIVVAETHLCEYCLSAHVAIAKQIGLDDAEIMKARQVQSQEPKIDAMLGFARNLLLRKADLPESDYSDLKATGVTDAEITEIIANVALNVFTNYFNHVAKTEVDFPKVKLAFPV